MKTLLGLLQRPCCGEQILRGPHSLWPRTSASLCGERPSSGGVKGPSQLSIYSAALSLWEVRLGGQSEKHLSKLGGRKDFGLRTVSCSGKNNGDL